jgi:hypothetical protein
MRSLAFSAFFALALLACLAPGRVSADTLLLTPSSGTYTEGQTFSVRVMVTSQAQAVNAVSATLSFPADKLQIVSVSKIGSILNLWVEEPAYSNAKGTLSLEGVVPNPGFTGANGPVLTINFRVIALGTASLSFPSGSLLANDGYGTNILRNRGTASYTLSPKAEATPAAPTEVAPTPVPVESASYVDLGESKAEPAPAQKHTISFGIPPWKDIYDGLLKFFSFAIPLLALGFLLLHTAKRGASNLRSLRRDIHNIDRLVEKSFDLIKEDMADSIQMLEKAGSKRKLTREEDAIIHRLRQNLAAAEKLIHKEVVQAERDLGD